MASTGCDDTSRGQVIDGGFGTRAVSDITVQNVNLTGLEDTPLQFSLQATSAGVMAESIRIVALTFPENGSLTQSGRQFVYTPAADFSGQDSFLYAGELTGARSKPATVTIDIASANDAPAVANLFYVTGQNKTLTAPFGAVDPEGDPIQYEIVTAPTQGSVTVNNTDGTFSYVPNGTFVGLAQFFFRAGDGQLNSSPARVDILVQDDVPPTLTSVLLESGAADTEFRNANLAVVADATAFEMKVTGDVAFPSSAWRPFVASQTVNLTPGDGTKSVWVRVRDELENAGQVKGDQILLDQLGPEATLTYDQYTRLITNQIAIDATDPSPPITMTLSGQITGSTPVSGTELAYSTPVTVYLQGGQGPRAVTVALEDKFDHVGGPYVASFTLDFTPPFGGISQALVPATSYVNQPLLPIPLTLSFGDLTSPVTAAVLGGDIIPASIVLDVSGFGAVGSTVPTVSPATVFLDADTDGPKQLTVYYLDAAGNKSPVYADIVTLDTAPPVLTSVTVAGGAAVTRDTVLILDVVAGPDAFEMEVTAVDQLGIPILIDNPVANFALGSSLPFTAVTTVTLNTGLFGVQDGQVNIFVNVRDFVGNASTPVGGTFILDRVAPSGSITSAVSGVTSDAVLPVFLSWSDANGVTAVSFSGDVASPLGWLTDFSAAAFVTLTTGDGDKSIQVEYVDAAGNVGGPFGTSVTLDTGVINGTVVPATFATSVTPVELNLTVQSGVAPFEVTLSGDLSNGFADTWMAYSTPVTVFLTAGEGVKSINVRFRDAELDSSVTYTAVITLDTSPPVLAITAPVPGGITSAIDGVHGTVSDGGTAPSGVTGLMASAQSPGFFYFDGVTFGSLVELLFPVAPNATWSWSAVTLDAGFGNGDYSLRAVAWDAAGNEADSGSQQFELDTVGPSCGTCLDLARSGMSVEYSNSVNVVAASVGVTDGATPIVARYSGDLVSPTGWVSYSSQQAITLTAGEGTKTVVVQYRDGIGNLSAMYADVLTLDTTAPAPVAVTLASGAGATSSTMTVADLYAAGAVTLDITGADITDQLGVAMASQLPVTLTAGEGAKEITVTYYDAAGNAASATDSVLLDQTAPSLASVVIASGSGAVSRTTVSLAISATGGPFQMQLTGDVSWPIDWVSYAASATAVLTVGDGPKTVYVTIRDEAQNPDGPVTDSVTLDQTPPAVPSGTTAYGGTYAVTVTWATAADAVFYWVYYDTDTGAPYGGTDATQGASPVSVAAPTTQVTLTGLQAPVTYYIAVQSGDNLGNLSSFSTEVTALTREQAMITATTTFANVVTGTRPLGRVDGAAAGDRFGQLVAVMDDVNGDQKLDFLVGNYSYNSDTGRVYAYSGADGSFIWQADGEVAGDQFGRGAAAIGDLNNDGVADLVVGALLNDDNGPDAGKIYALSGTNGAAIWTRLAETADDRFGSAIAPAGDLDGDGSPDVLVGADVADFGGADFGSVYALSGTDGSNIFRIDSIDGGNFAGPHRVTGGYDLDGDGTPDLIVGAPRTSLGGADSGSVYAFSGTDGSQLWRIDGAAGDRIGDAIDIAGDVDGDGLADPVVLAPRADNGGTDSGAVYALSGTNGATLVAADGQGDSASAPDGYAHAEAIPDVTADGVPDILASDFNADTTVATAGSVLVIDGSSGQVLFRVDGVVSGAVFGRDADVADVDGNGWPELIVGADRTDILGADTGSVYAFELTGISRALTPLTSTTVGFTGSGSAVTADARLNGGAWAPLGTATTATTYSNLSEGTQSLDARAFDPDSAAGPTITIDWDVDLTPPTVTLVQPVSSATTSSTQVTGTVADVVSNGVGGQVLGIRWAAKLVSSPTDVWWNGYEFRVHAPVYFFQPTTTDWSFALPATGAGDYEVRVVGVDGAFQSSSSVTSSSFSYVP